jgi:hypothetical protein
MDAINLTLPAQTGGRIVMGNPLIGFNKDLQGRPYLNKHGQPITRYNFNLAIPKTDPYLGQYLETIDAAARAGFPHLFDAAGNCLHPSFAHKYVDGDDTKFDQQGTRWCDKEGYPGHYVFMLGTTIAPKVYRMVGGHAIELAQNELKTGDYVRCHGSVKGNEDTSKPGVFLNPGVIEFVGSGQEIISGPNPSAVIGAAAPVQMPTGASTVPVASTTTLPPGVKSVPPPSMPQSVLTARAVPHPPAVGVQPAPEFLKPPEMFMAEGKAYTRTQLQGFGWTDPQINTLPRA